MPELQVSQNGFLEEASTQRSLRDFCTCEAKLHGDEFVGIRYDGKIQINFPLGYFKDDHEIQEMEEEALRDEVRNLFEILSDSNLSDVHEDSSYTLHDGASSSVSFPMRSYLSLLRDFIEFGYLSEQDVSYRQGGNGRISWSRTIKKTHPTVLGDGKNIFYLNPIARHVNRNETEIISLIHKFCVQDASRKIGFLFGIDIEEQSVLDFDYEVFSSVLLARISHTFNDRHLRLFQDMLRIVEYLGERSVFDNSLPDTFHFGVHKFEHIWESLVNNVFGNEPREKYNPHCGWKIAGASPAEIEMRPDTVMSFGGELFIIDSKFYSYGGGGNSLPQTESITKQLAYAEYAEHISGKVIHNVFILPYCAGAESGTTGNVRPFRMQYIGYAYSDWKNIDKSAPAKGPVKTYHKIHAFYLDVKSLMKDYTNSKFAQKALADYTKEKEA